MAGQIPSANETFHTYRVGWSCGPQSWPTLAAGEGGGSLLAAEAKVLALVWPFCTSSLAGAGCLANAQRGGVQLYSAFALGMMGRPQCPVWHLSSLAPAWQGHSLSERSPSVTHCLLLWLRTGMFLQSLRFSELRLWKTGSQGAVVGSVSASWMVFSVECAMGSEACLQGWPLGAGLQGFVSFPGFSLPSLLPGH